MCETNVFVLNDPIGGLIDVILEVFSKGAKSYSTGHQNYLSEYYEWGVEGLELVIFINNKICPKLRYSVRNKGKVTVYHLSELKPIKTQCS
jgi:hypothetical protein